MSNNNKHLWLRLFPRLCIFITGDYVMTMFLLLLLLLLLLLATALLLLPLLPSSRRGCLAYLWQTNTEPYPCSICTLNALTPSAATVLLPSQLLNSPSTRFDSAESTEGNTILLNKCGGNVEFGAVATGRSSFRSSLQAFMEARHASARLGGS
jgi:hypothetical protein